MIDKNGNNPAFTSRRKVLPVVEKMRSNIDTLYLRFVGPMGDSLATDVFNQWVDVDSGNIGPSGLRRYISMLSNEIPELAKSREFTASAVKLIRLI